jgi:hypothetical protein
MTTDSQAEIAASVAALHDLGPGYDQALAEGLVERIGADARPGPSELTAPPGSPSWWPSGPCCSLCR